MDRIPAAVQPRPQGLAKGWQVRRSSRPFCSSTVRTRTGCNESGGPRICDNGFRDCCSFGRKRHRGIANPQVRNYFCGGRGTRTHKSVRTTVFKSVIGIFLEPRQRTTNPHSCWSEAGPGPPWTSCEFRQFPSLRRPVDGPFSKWVNGRSFCFTRRSRSRGLLGPKLDSPLSKEEEMKVPIWVWVLVGIILVIVIVRLV